METLIDNDRLTITRRPGETGRAVISFAGVGFGLHGIQKEEFARTLSGAQHDQIFVIDRTRSWYNATAGEIEDRLAPHLEQFSAGVFTLGNSMGGFGAVYFASRLAHCKGSVAFAPQFSLHPDLVPGETRWGGHRGRIKRWKILDAVSGARTGVRHFVFFGRAGRDRAHARLFLDHGPPEMAVFLIDGPAHAVAPHLRDTGALLPTLDAIFLEGASARQVEAVLRDNGVRVSVRRAGRLAGVKPPVA